MKKILFLLLAFFASNSYAQDTIYYNTKNDVVDPLNEGATEYEVQGDFEGSEFDSISKRYSLDGNLKLEKTFNWDEKEQKRVYAGTMKAWYASGKPFYSIEFEDGVYHGNMIVLHENGQIKRKDIFKKNKLKKGQVWDENGKELDYVPHVIKPEFPGGLEALKRYLSENIRVPKYIKSGETHLVKVRFVINKSGEIEEYKIVEKPADNFYAHETLRVLKQMPNWKPATKFGEKVRFSYGLPVVFRG